MYMKIQIISHLYDDLQATNIEAENIGIINKYYLINNWTLLQKEGNKNEIKEEKNNFNIQRKLLKMSDILVQVDRNANYNYFGCIKN